MKINNKCLPSESLYTLQSLFKNYQLTLSIRHISKAFLRDNYLLSTFDYCWYETKQMGIFFIFLKQNINRT